MKAIRAKHLYPVSAEPIENGVVLVEDGKIVAVGQELPIPAGTEVLECDSVTPGLIDAQTYISLSFEPRGMREHSDNDECSDPLTPQIRVADGIYPLDLELHRARCAGVTSVFVSTGFKNVIGGVGTAIKTGAVNDPEAMVIPGTEQMVAAVGAIPVGFHSRKGRAPQSNMGLFAMLRDYLREAKEYAASDSPAYDAKLEAMKPVMQGKMPLRVHACTAEDMLRVIRLTEEFGIRLIFVNATEGYVIADTLREKGIPCIVGAMFAYPFRTELWRHRTDNAARIKEAGLELLALTCDETNEIELLRPYSGRLTVLGMTDAQVLEALTLVPARILGADDRIGSLEPGKDADLAFFNGDPLSNLTACLGCMIGGTVYTEGRDDR